MGDRIKLILFLVTSFPAVGGLTACSSPGYILHWREPTQLTRLNFLDPPRENTPIASEDGVALLYDRTPYVAYEEALSDGSVWVHYGVVLSNGTERQIGIDPGRVRLEGHGGVVASAQYEPSDRTKEVLTLEPNTNLRFSTRFHLTQAFLDRYADSPEPLDLVVPTTSGKDMKLKLWLWKD